MIDSVYLRQNWIKRGQQKMQVFRLFAILVGILALSSCSETDYGLVIGTVEKETIIEYVEVEPEVEIWVESFTQVGAFDEMDICGL
jgi:hypothetical protein